MSVKFDPSNSPVSIRELATGRGRLVGVRSCGRLAALTDDASLPLNWMLGRETDWRLMVSLTGAISIPLGLRLLKNELRAVVGRPATRLGIVWRFAAFYGGLLAAGLQAPLALTMMVAFRRVAYGRPSGAPDTTFADLAAF
jgi:hypothetical protein